MGTDDSSVQECSRVFKRFKEGSRLEESRGFKTRGVKRVQRGSSGLKRKKGLKMI
jgi:hypothetical protein